MSTIRREDSIKFVDRRGVVTRYQYDALYRLTFIGFGATGDPANPSYQSSITFTYDTVGRLTQVVDSAFRNYQLRV